MKRTLTLLVAFFSFSFAMNVEEISGLQNGLAKDFLIYEYAKNHKLSWQEAQKLYSQIHRKTYRLKVLFSQYLKDEKLNFTIKCQKLSPKEILNASPKCASLAITPAKMEKTDLKLRKKIHYYFKKPSWLEAMNKKDIFTHLSKVDGDEFLKFFLGVSKEYRYKNLDKNIPQQFLKNISKHKRFENFVLNVVMDEGYKNLPKSLLKLDSNTKNLSFNSYFYLGLLHLMHEQKENATLFFANALNATEDESLKNKARFWIFQSSLNKEIFTSLANSKRIDIYSLYAKEQLGVKLSVTVPLAPKKQRMDSFSHTDPFSWDYTKEHIKDINKTELAKFSKPFYTKQTLPYFVNLTQKIVGWDEEYFITPYEQYISHLSTKRKILIYALARQESRCIPVVVSKSYALGMMQFMPFLAKDMAKKKKLKDFDYFDMFKPQIALDFANTHLDYLNSRLKHPVFIAYAYNGGIGFTTRMLKNTNLFNEGRYEPFLSMELVPYAESREYAKKVLVNYSIYSKLYSDYNTVTSLLDSLKK